MRCIDVKYCYECKLNIPVERFNNNRAKRDGLATECKLCKSHKDREYRKTAKERISIRTKKWREANRVQLNINKNKWAKANPEKK